MESLLLKDIIKQTVTDWLGQEGHSLTNFYSNILSEIEKPLLEAVMQHVGGNQSKAAMMLGLNRGTTRKLLKKHGLVP